jgi:predicted Rossmann fold flavoprotein
VRRVVVIGAGAAGSMAAIFAASRGAATRLLERTRDGGRKILISGGGRCNVLPARLSESRFVTESPPHLLRKLLRAWPLPEQIAFFEQELGLPLVEETESAKLFPASQRARDVRDGLLLHAAKRGAELVMDARVTGVWPREGHWIVEREGSPALEADAIVLATGGLSVPKTGSDGFGLELLARLGHTIHPTYPALTPLLAPPGPLTDLAGISLPVTLSARSERLSAQATGGFLFTHQGYSGPAVLDVSHVAVRAGSGGARLSVRWTALGEAEWTTALRPQGARSVGSVLRERLPHRLADVLLAGSGVEPARPLAQLSREARLRLVQALVRGELPWNAHAGYAKAEVMGGGASLAEIDPLTMESRKHPGLFLSGELLDAFGPIGGYNFYWAWATGRAAGTGAAG